MPASQDFRDGAASGAGAIAYRVRHLAAWGVPLTPDLVDKLAESVAYDMGGTVYPIGSEPTSALPGGDK